MDEPVELTYQITREECVAASMSQFFRGRRKWAPIIGVVFLLYMGLSAGMLNGDTSVPLVCAAGVIFLVAFPLIFTRLQASWAYARTPGILSPLTIRICDDHFSMKSAAGESEIKRLWRVSEDRRFIFGHVSPAAYILIPRRVFSSNKQREKVKGVLIRMTCSRDRQAESAG